LRNSSPKKLNFSQCLAIGLGNIIGAGIFVLAGTTIDAAGPSAILAFILTAILATTVGLNSAELSSKFPKVEGGVYSFAKVILGDTVGFLVGFLRLISYAISGSAVALGFSGYLVAFNLPIFLYYPIAAVLIVILGLIEMHGLRFTAKFEQIFVAFNIIGLVIFSLVAILYSHYNPNNFYPFAPYGLNGILQASAIAFFAYSGFNTIATLTPDVENGEKVVPKAIIASLFISSSLYILVIVSLLLAMNWGFYGLQSNPLSIALSSIHAPYWVVLIVGLSALTSTLSVTLSLIVAGSRTLKQMATDALLPNYLGRNNKISTAIIIFIMLLSLFLGNVESIALVANFGVIFSYLLSGIEVFFARRRKIKSTFNSPGYPAIQILSIALSSLMLIVLGNLSLELGILTLIAGLIIHVIHEEIKSNRKILNK